MGAKRRTVAVLIGLCSVLALVFQFGAIVHFDTYRSLVIVVVGSDGVEVNGQARGRTVKVGGRPHGSKRAADREAAPNDARTIIAKPPPVSKDHPNAGPQPWSRKRTLFVSKKERPHGSIPDHVPRYAALPAPPSSTTGPAAAREKQSPNPARFLDYSAFDAAVTNHATLSFYHHDDAIPPPCPLLVVTEADPQEYTPAQSRSTAPTQACWRQACDPAAGGMCFGGCQCPAGPCRVVSVFKAAGGNGGQPMQETLRCVDSSALFADTATSSYSDTVGVAPIAESTRIAHSLVEDRYDQRYSVHSGQALPVPLVCPARPAADHLPSMRGWLKIPAADVPNNDRLLQHWMRRRDAARQRGFVRTAQELEQHIIGRTEDLRVSGLPAQYTPAMRHEEKLALFQHATAWRPSFPKWRKWEGRCSKVRHGGRMRGYHSRRDGYYRLENVCFGTGKEPLLSGFEPELEAFEGTDEHVDGAGQTFTATVRKLLERTVPVKATPGHSECFMHTNTVLMPPRSASARDPAAASRLAMTALRAMPDWFPGSTEDPLMLYLEDPLSTASNEESAHDTFAPLLSDFAAHLSVRSGPGATNSDSLRRETGAPVATSRVCFRWVVIAHVCRSNGRYKACTGKDKATHPVQATGGKHLAPQWRSKERQPYQRPKLTDKAPDHTADAAAAPVVLVPIEELSFAGKQSGEFIPAGNQHSFVLHGRRGLETEKTLDVLRGRVGRCLGTKPRGQRRADHPHVLHVLQTDPRHIDGSAVRYGDVAQLSYERGAKRYTAIDITRPAANPAVYLQHFIDADLLIAPYGSALLWQMLMPPGAVVIATGTPSRSASSKAKSTEGTGRRAATWTTPEVAERERQMMRWGNDRALERTDALPPFTADAAQARLVALNIHAKAAPRSPRDPDHQDDGDAAPPPSPRRRRKSKNAVLAGGQGADMWRPEGDERPTEEDEEDEDDKDNDEEFVLPGPRDVHTTTVPQLSPATVVATVDAAFCALEVGSGEVTAQCPVPDVTFVTH